MSASLRSSPITRSWLDTVKNVAIAAATAVGAVILWHNEVAWLAVLVGIVGSIFIFAAIWIAGTASCPHCGNQLKGIAKIGFHCCPLCKHYVEGKAGRVWELDPGRVAESPTFDIPLPDSFHLPSTCCYCGAPATRMEEVGINLCEVKSSMSIMGREVRYTVSMPHCDQHLGGAKLDRTLSTQEPAAAITVLKVRSYRFYREFLEMNGLAGSTATMLARPRELLK